MEPRANPHGVGQGQVFHRVGATVAASGKLDGFKCRNPGIKNLSRQLLRRLHVDEVVEAVLVRATRSPVEIIQAVPTVSVTADWGWAAMPHSACAAASRPPICPCPSIRRDAEEVGTGKTVNVGGSLPAQG